MASKAISMKTLYRFWSEFVVNDLKSYQNLEQSEAKKAHINEFLDYVWENRNK